MARALVIKGSNFSANKVTTVNINGGTSCTGIEFAEDTITIIGTDNIEVEYTLTPPNTTDVVTWESSDTDIITVDNGVITPVGVGTCTLTATCNGHTATATVTVQMFYVKNWIFYQGMKSSNGYVYLSQSYYWLVTSGTSGQATDYVMYGSIPAPLPKAVKLPKNTTKVKITRTTGTVFDNGNSSAQLIWAKDESAGYGSYPDAIKAISTEDAYNPRTYDTKVYDVPSGVDSMAFTIKLAQQKSASDDPNDVATSGGLVIEFLAE